MNRARIISAVVLLAVLGVFGAVWQFYLKERLAEYTRDEVLRDNLEQTYTELKTTFKGYKPELLTQAWQSQVSPWTEALASRGGYFDVEGMYEVDKYPEGGPIMRFWFDETTAAKQQEFYAMAQTKMGRWDLVPQDILTTLSIPRVSHMSGFPITQEMMDKALSRLSFGINTCEMLMDAGATRIDNVVVWPVRKANDLIRLHTSGVSFTMPAETLVRFLEQLRTADRYYNVESIKLSWPYLAMQTEPQLQVSMVLTMAKFKARPASATARAPGAGGASGASAAGAAAPGFQTARALFASEGLGEGDTGIITPKELSVPQKMWKWFKRYILYTN
jgi:hypothetical protein